MKAQRVFEDAIDLPLAERGAFLDRACEGDPALRREVESLLASFERAEGFLSEPSISMSRLPGMGADATRVRAPGDVEDMLTVFERPGDLVGRYRLVEEIGSGGFGVVFKAEQTEPVKRHVALKIIKVGMDTRQRMARFDAERQALAMMDHPNIAKVLDAGATPTGRLYFVMELVEGATITRYSDDHKLSIEQRLELFRQVCSAVQHAHQKGIIHRDIKPSNVLVSIVDGKPAPKVIDFGIAKAINVTLTERTLFTESHQVLGTPAYMSPEQADNADSDIDTRTDVYSLGVLLYELLTGVTPFDFAHMRTIALGEMLRMIRQDEPIKPSLKLSKDTSGTIAADRRSDTRRLGSTLRGDLDWIVMKCLEKDRTRRYATAQSIAEDVQRYLGNEPVMAGPPSVGYRAAKFYKRNRAAVLAGSAFGVLIVAGIAALAGMYLRVLQQRGVTETAQVGVQNSTGRLGLALLSSINSRQGQLGREKILAQLNQLREQTDSVNWDRLSRSEYDIRRILAVGYLCLGEESLGGLQAELFARVGERVEQPISTIDSRRQLAGELFQQATLRSQSGDTAAAERLLLHARDLLETNNDAGSTGYEQVQVSLAAIFSERREYTAADAMLQRSISALSKNAPAEAEPVLAEATYNAAVVSRSLGRREEAMKAAREALSFSERLFSAGHHQIVKSMALIGLLYHEAGRSAEAQTHFEQAESLAAQWPPQSTDRRFLVEMYASHGYVMLVSKPLPTELFEKELEYSLEQAMNFAPDGTPTIAQGYIVLGSTRRMKGDYAGAEKWMSRAHALSAVHDEWPVEVTRRSRGILAAIRMARGLIGEGAESYRDLALFDERTGNPDRAKSRQMWLDAEEKWRYFCVVDAWEMYRAFFVRPM